ncbi:unnamed protein product [Adineta steineri]|uniref:Uncharacterized protein n=1 Tax=Adineta steineri TaxID=433720 RepID=A0A814W3A5_9BILA|nr:unnamed protein product [Adineta steineri]
MPQILNDNEQKGDKSNKKHGDKKRNLAMVCLAILSGSSMLSCFVFTISLIYMLGYKWAIIAGQIGILIYTAANMYPKAVLLYPGKYISNKSTVKHMFVFGGNNSDIQSCITCTIGIQYIGLVMVSYGITGCISSMNRNDMLYNYRISNRENDNESQAKVLTQLVFDYNSEHFAEL